MKRVLLIVLAAVLLPPASAAASPYTDAVSASAPWGWWRLGEKLGHDRGRPGRADAGRVERLGLGGVGGALAGDTDTAVSVGGSSGVSLGTTFSPATAFTLEAWVNLPSRSSTRYLLSRGSGSAGIHLLLVAGTPTMRVSTTSATISISSPTSLGDGQLAPPGRHLRRADDDFVRRRRAVNTPRRSRARSGQRPLALTGGRYSSGGSGFNGRLDELAVYDRALTGIEIAAHAAAGLDADVAAVVASPAHRRRAPTTAAAPSP